MVISNDEYCKRFNTQIERSSFTQLPYDITKSFEKKLNDFIVKWEDLRVFDKKWASYIKSNYCKPGSMYGLSQMHKENNPVRVITSGCGTAIEYLSIFVEKYLYREVNKIDFRIIDTPDMLSIIDMISDSNILTEDSVLISFDIVDMFPSIYNVSEILENRETNFPPAECILEALKLCLKCNNSVFNEKFYLQEDGTTMGPHMSCSCSDIAMYRFDLKALSYTPKALC